MIDPNQISLSFVLLLVFAYLLGAVPFGLLWGRIFADVDIRDFGSGNIGATNMNRILGKKLGAATLASDILKAVFVVVLAELFLRDKLQASLVGFAAIVGHCYPIYLKFKGGKGVATTFGTILVISPVTALVAAVIWIIVFRISKISALSALVAAIVIPFLLYFEQGLKVAEVFLLVVVLIFIRHKSNIQRIREGKAS